MSARMTAEEEREVARLAQNKEMLQRYMSKEITKAEFDGYLRKIDSEGTAEAWEKYFGEQDGLEIIGDARETLRKNRIRFAPGEIQSEGQQTNGEMALAAALYASPVHLYKLLHGINQVTFLDAWPWHPSGDLRERSGNKLRENGELLERYDADELTSRMEMLAMAGALVAAEMDRIRSITRPQIIDEEEEGAGIQTAGGEETGGNVGG